MKKGIQKNNQAIALWQSVRIDGRIYSLVKESRISLGVPENGFNSSEEYDKWLSEVDEKKRISIVYGFIDECKKIIPYEQILTDVHFSSLLIDFFYYTEVDDDLFKGFEFSGMRIKILKEGKVILSASNVIEDGVYIKINPYLEVSQIKNFIDTHKELVKESQDLFLASLGLGKRKRINFNPNYSRDRMILAFDEYKKSEIDKSFDVKAEYKDIAISKLMSEMGVKNITPSVVKNTKERRKLKK